MADIYQDRYGNQIGRPRRESSFLDRRGAFTGPNNDPLSPGMSRIPVTEPELTMFHPDDSRYEQRKAQIAAKNLQAEAEQRRAVVADSRAQEELRRTERVEDRRVAEEERLRRQAREDREEAIKADAARRQAELAEADIAAKRAWSAENGGAPYSPQLAAEVMKRKQSKAVADEHDATVNEVNASESSLNKDLDYLSAGGPPTQDLRDLIEQITGKKYGTVPVDSAAIQKIRDNIKTQADTARANAATRLQALLGLLRVTERRTSEDEG